MKPNNNALKQFLKRLESEFGLNADYARELVVSELGGLDERVLSYDEAALDRVILAAIEQFWSKP